MNTMGLDAHDGGGYPLGEQALSPKVRGDDPRNVHLEVCGGAVAISWDSMAHSYTGEDDHMLAGRPTRR